jgi:hypothetical protein
MRRIRLSVAAAVVAASFVVAPAAQAAESNPLEKYMWVVKCVGDSLGGNACHQ